MSQTEDNPGARRPILEVKDLRTVFRTAGGVARAVDGVSFSVNRGETYALVGESGCGKSVTALSVLQLVPRPAGAITGGQVLLDGEVISALPPIRMRRIRGKRISMIFQEPMTALNPVFTVGYQIAEVLCLHERLDWPAARRQTVEMLQRVGIPDPETRYHDYPYQMSGGMRQRIMIAMALACRPELLIADEPTTALDVTIQSQILGLIRTLKDDLGTAVLLITHDMGVVSENAQRVGVMYAGWLVEEADRNAIFEAPAHPYTRLLLRALPSKVTPNAALTTIPGTVPRATAFPAGCRFHTRCPHVMPRCRVEEPPSYRAAEGHTARCFLLDRDTRHVSISEPQPEAAPSRTIHADTATLTVSELKVHFPIRAGFFRRTVAHVRAVDGINLSLARGETLALVGESGCGKTTVGKSIVRLVDPTAGSVHFGEADISKLSRKAMLPFRRKVQMIFQDPFSSLDPRQRVGDILAEGMIAHHIAPAAGERARRVRDLMSRVGLDPDMTDRYPHEFSGGQRQRIGIARALVMQPELIVCDEATSSLDVSVQAQILNLLRQLQSEMDLSYLFISHDLSVVRYVSDRIAVMYLGRIVETGPSTEVIDHPCHPYTRALIAAVPEIGGDGQRRIVLPGDVPSPVNPPAGCHFHPRCPFAHEECRHIDPPLEPTGADTSRQAACIRKDEIERELS